MPDGDTSIAMAEEVLSAASKEFLPGEQIPNYDICLKMLRTLTSTIRTAFKMRARREVPTHYNLNHPSDPNAEVTHRQQRVPTLVENHAYLFADERSKQDSLSPVNHPSVSAVILATVWETGFHAELDLDDVDSLDNLYALSGAATHSAIMEYRNGRRQTVEFSVSSSSGAEYSFIQEHNLTIRKKRAEIRTKTAALWKARPPCSTSKASTFQNLPSKIYSRYHKGVGYIVFYYWDIIQIDCLAASVALVLECHSSLVFFDCSFAQPFSPSSRFAEIPMASVIYCRALTTGVEFEVA
ncbi:hypothetical protein BDR07DRAFT_1485531 [Suillus spraguei]|nr:hypothetical protein BDR07DRAFT_1485531 [Suillus spraguei]